MRVLAVPSSGYSLNTKLLPAVWFPRDYPVRWDVMRVQRGEHLPKLCLRLHPVLAIVFSLYGGARQHWQMGCPLGQWRNGSAHSLQT